MNVEDPAKAKKLIEGCEKVLVDFLDGWLFTHSGWQVTMDEINDDQGIFIRATVVYPAKGPTPSLRNLSSDWIVDTVYVLGRERGIDLTLWDRAEDPRNPLVLNILFVQKEG